MFFNFFIFFLLRIFYPQMINIHQFFLNHLLNSFYFSKGYIRIYKLIICHLFGNYFIN